MPRYIKRALTQRTLLQNKMAADLSTLISLFLDSKLEKYASYFLDFVNSKQQFNTEIVKRLEFTMQYTFSLNIFAHVQIFDMTILLMYFVISHRTFSTNGKEKSIASLIQRMKVDLSYFSWIIMDWLYMVRRLCQGLWRKHEGFPSCAHVVFGHYLIGHFRNIKYSAW